jgi:FlaA1/EpsC-like NDP-sugar epimerase
LLTRILSLFLAWPRGLKRALVVGLDVALVAFTAWLALALRLETLTPKLLAWMTVFAVSASVALPLFAVHGLYHAVFRYSGWNALMSLGRAMALYTFFSLVLFTWFKFAGVPRSVGLSQPLMLLVLVACSRLVARALLDPTKYRSRSAQKRVLIYGAGATGRQMAGAMGRSPAHKLLGYLDDDDRLHGHSLDGLRVYNPQAFEQVLARTGAQEVLLAMPSATRAQRNRILDLLRVFPVRVSTLPSMADLASGSLRLEDVRELDIEDLLGRDPVQPHGLLINLNTHGKTVLVTGAGGSIGSELCRQILRTSPKQLLLVEMSEFALYQIHQELQADPSSAQVELVPLLASVCDEVRMHEIMDTWKPHTVYHAAAYKHVPLVEHNPAEGVRNNVWGTRVCAEAAARNGVRNFVLISTDKAVRPTNIMGASKRLAEMVLQALADGSPRYARDDDTNVTASPIPVTASAAKQSTTFSMVRFGNVLGSSGSVVPLFREQIKNGGPITLTHADITRYFMTIPEAAQLVIQAGAMGQGGDVFVLDMGEPVKIIDLARRMVELSGLTVRDEADPSGDIELAVTGLRPGEKLFEELLIGDNPKPTQHPRIMKAHEQFLSWPELSQRLNALQLAIGVNDVPAIRGLLQQLVSGYQPSGEVVDWVHLANEREASAGAV